MIKFMYFWWASLLVPSLLLCGCGTVKRTRTITETTIKTDTVLLIKKDTIPIIKIAELHDTIFLENTTSKVTVWYDTIYKKIVAKLEGKPFEVTVKINSHIRIVNYEKTITRKPNYFFYILCLGIIIGIVELLRLIKRKI